MDSSTITNTTNPRPFAVFDIDGTLVRWQLYHAVANELLKQGTDPELYDTIRQARLRWKQRTHPLSFTEYEHVLITAYEATLQHISVESFDRAATEVFNEYKDQAYTYTRDLITKLKNQDYFLLAISGSQKELVSKIADYYGFDDCVGTEYRRQAGKFTGEKTLGSKDKHKILKGFIKKHQLSLKGSYAVGDSESDIPMLQMVENPIAFNPTQTLFDKAKQEGWDIVVERKNVIYKLASKGSFRMKEDCERNLLA